MPVKAYTVLFLFTLFLSCKKETLQIVATPVSVPTTLTLNKIIFTDAQHGFIAGGDRYSAVVVLSCSGLSTPWKIVQLPETTEKREAYDIESNPQGHIAICGYGGTFYYSTDTGNTFQYYQHSSWSSLRAMAYCTQHQLAIVEGHSFSKGFLSWFEPTSKQLSNKQQEWNFECSDICFPDASTGYISGYGAVLKSIDSGLHWTYTAAKNDFFKSMFWNNSMEGIAVGYEGTIIKTYDGGESWSVIRNGNSMWQKKIHLLQVAGLQNGTMVAVGESGVAMLSRDHGAHWEYIKKFTSNDLRGVAFSDEHTCWICGSGGSLFRLPV